MSLRLKPGLIVVDKRESRSEVPKLLAKLGISLRYDLLEVGDYMLPGGILVERKTVKDFISSLLDGRLFDQAVNLLRASENPTIIIEGDLKEALINRAVFWGALASLGYDFKLTLFYTPRAEETASLLATISRRKRGEGEEIHLKPKRKRGELEELQLNILSSLPGVGASRAKKLLEGFGSLKAIFNATPTELSRIGRIPYEVGVRIYDLINAEYRSSERGKQSRINSYRR